MIYTQSREAYELYKNRSDYELEQLIGDDWLEEQASRSFVDGLYRVLDNIGYYNRPSNFFYGFKGWVGDDMILMPVDMRQEFIDKLTIHQINQLEELALAYSG